LNLPLSEDRRRRGYLIEMFKLTNSKGYVNFLEPLRFLGTCPEVVTTKGFTVNWLKRVYLTNRVVNDWNSLSQDAIDSTNKNTFKNKIDKILNFNFCL